MQCRADRESARSGWSRHAAEAAGGTTVSVPPPETGSLWTHRWSKPDSNFQFLTTVSFVRPRYHSFFCGTGADVCIRATAFDRRGITPNRGTLYGDLTEQLKVALR